MLYFQNITIHIILNSLGGRKGFISLLLIPYCGLLSRRTGDWWAWETIWFPFPSLNLLMQNAARSLVLFLSDGHTYNFNSVLQFTATSCLNPCLLKEVRSWCGLSPKDKRMTIPNPTQFTGREWRQGETAALVRTGANWKQEETANPWNERFQQM